MTAKSYIQVYYTDPNGLRQQVWIEGFAVSQERWAFWKDYPGVIEGWFVQNGRCIDSI